MMRVTKKKHFCLSSVNFSCRRKKITKENIPHLKINNSSFWFCRHKTLKYKTYPLACPGKNDQPAS